MVVFADSEGLAEEAFGGKAKQSGLSGVVRHWFLVYKPVSAVPRPAGKAGVLPVCVGIDEIHIALGIKAQWPEDNCAGYQRFAAQVILYKVSHSIEVGLFRLGQKPHPVEDSDWALTFSKHSNRAGLD